jgi:hypothetical protein
MTNTAAPELAIREANLAADNTRANSLLLQGATVAALGAAGAAIGAACPLCVVVAPALLAGGVFKKARVWLAHRDQS